MHAFNARTPRPVRYKPTRPAHSAVSEQTSPTVAQASAQVGRGSVAAMHGQSPGEHLKSVHVLSAPRHERSHSPQFATSMPMWVQISHSSHGKPVWHSTGGTVISVEPLESDVLSDEPPEPKPDPEFGTSVLVLGVTSPESPSPVPAGGLTVRSPQPAAATNPAMKTPFIPSNSLVLAH